MDHTTTRVQSNRTDSFSRVTGDPVLGIREVLEALGEEPGKPLARSTFDRWRAIGKAPKCMRLPNGSLRVRYSALEKFLRSCEE